jgi:hypothetical protein
MQYGILNQKSLDFDLDRVKKLDDFYVGGFQVLKNSKKYLTKDLSEHAQRYEDRIKTSSYINYLSQIIDYFASNLFSQDLAVLPAGDAEDPTTPGDTTTDPFYQQFAANSDLGGNAFTTVLQQSITNAMLQKATYIQVDFPSVDNPPINAIGMEDVSNSPFITILPNECVIDFEKDEYGSFVLFVIKREITKRQGLESKRDTKVIQFKVWERDESGNVNWKIFETQPIKLDKEPADDDEVSLTSEGTTTFKRIPIVEVCVNDGLWIGNKIGPMVQEHFNRRSALIASQAKSLFCVPFAKLGSEMGSFGGDIPSEAQNNPNRGNQLRQSDLLQKGYVVVGKDDELGYLEPTGAAYTLVNEQINELVEQMMQVVSQMANSIANNSQALGRSGLSKMADQEATNKILTAYGNIVREAAKAVYRIIAEARGDDIIWQVHGLTNYEFADRDQLLKEAMAVQNLGIHSETFNKLYQSKIALALLGNVSPETTSVIRKEIEEAVESMGHEETDPDVDADETEEPGSDDDSDQGKPPAPTGKPSKARSEVA